MYNSVFDSFKRKAENKNSNIKVKEIFTGPITSKETEAWAQVWNSTTSSDKLHASFDYPHNIVTFYIISDNKEKEKDKTNAIRNFDWRETE